MCNCLDSYVTCVMSYLQSHLCFFIFCCLSWQLENDLLSSETEPLTSSSSIIFLAVTSRIYNLWEERCVCTFESTLYIHIQCVSYSCNILLKKAHYLFAFWIFFSSFLLCIMYYNLNRVIESSNTNNSINNMLSYLLNFCLFKISHTSQKDI